MKTHVLGRREGHGANKDGEDIPVGPVMVCYLETAVGKWGKEKATHSSSLAWEIAWTEEPGEL